MSAWLWLLAGVILGGLLMLFIVREWRIYAGPRRGGTIDLVGVKPYDPDDWLTPPAELPPVEWSLIGDHGEVSTIVDVREAQPKR